MPLNVKSFGVSCFISILFSIPVFAQTGSQADVIKQKINRSRAFVAARNYTAAAIELEDIRRSTNDESIQNIALVMLMQVYLETPDYKRAQYLLNESFENQKRRKDDFATYYFPVAGQVIRSAKNQLERYKLLGVSVSDRNLPAEAVVDLENMRGMLEVVADQAKTLSAAKKRSSESLGLLEEVSNARSALARDGYDASRWQNVVADARETLSNSQTVVVSTDDSGVGANTNQASVNPNSNSQTTTNNVAMTTPKTNPTLNIPPKNVVTETPKPQTTPTKTETNTVAMVPTSANKEPVVEKNNKNNKKPEAKIQKTPEKPAERSIEKNNTVAESKPIDTPKPNNSTASQDPLIASFNGNGQEQNNTVSESNTTATNTVVEKSVEKNGDAENGKVQPIIQKTNPPPVTSTPAETTPIPISTPIQTNPTPTPTETTPTVVDSSPLSVGSLMDYATQKTPPIYPEIARRIGVKGLVKIELLLDESGAVSKIQSSTGPDLLKRSALDAIKKWKFRPILRDGQPVKAVGFINFNFQ